MGSDLNELQNFEQLIAALSAHFGIPLDGSDRTVIIVDEAEKLYWSPSWPQHLSGFT